MTTTDVDWSQLLVQVNDATKTLHRSATVPEAVAQLVDSFDPALHASAPMHLQADPYLAITLFAAAFRAEKALRHDDPEAQRRDLRTHSSIFAKRCGTSSLTGLSAPMLQSVMFWPSPLQR